MEDARYWIGLLQYYRSTATPLSLSQSLYMYCTMMRLDKSYLHSLAQQPEKKYVSAGIRLRAVVTGEYFTTIPPMPLSVVSHEAMDGWKIPVWDKNR